jgi:hypothetical protein
MGCRSSKVADTWTTVTVGVGNERKVKGPANSPVKADGISPATTMRVAIVKDGRRPTTTDHKKLLKSFYHALGGPRWKLKENWLSNKPLGEWFGIGVDDEGSVVEINLTDNKLAGSFPDCLPETLEELVLTNNRVRGPLPRVLPPNLKIFDCTANMITGASFFSLLRTICCSAS